MKLFNAQSEKPATAVVDLDSKVLGAEFLGLVSGGYWIIRPPVDVKPKTDGTKETK